VCFGDFQVLPPSTLFDAYHKEFESRQRLILDISAKYSEIIKTRDKAHALPPSAKIGGK